jgi:hypothetical protein
VRTIAGLEADGEDGADGYVIVLELVRQGFGMPARPLHTRHRYNIRIVVVTVTQLQWQLHGDRSPLHSSPGQSHDAIRQLRLEQPRH